MILMEQRVQAVELLCQQTLANCQSGVAGRDGETGGAVRINSEAVQKCVGNVVKLAKAMVTDDSRFFLAVSSSRHVLVVGWVDLQVGWTCACHTCQVLQY